MKDILYFDNMLTPKIITFIYWILVIAVVLAGLQSIFNGEILSGLGIIVGGSIAVRVWCELMIIFFKMNEALQEIRKK